MYSLLRLNRDNIHPRNIFDSQKYNINISDRTNAKNYLTNKLTYGTIARIVSFYSGTKILINEVLL